MSSDHSYADHICLLFHAVAELLENMYMHTHLTSIKTLHPYENNY